MPGLMPSHRNTTNSREPHQSSDSTWQTIIPYDDRCSVSVYFYSPYFKQITPQSSFRQFPLSCQIDGPSLEGRRNACGMLGAEGGGITGGAERSGSRSSLPPTPRCLPIPLLAPPSPSISKPSAGQWHLASPVIGDLRHISGEIPIPSFSTFLSSFFRSQESSIDRRKPHPSPLFKSSSRSPIRPCPFPT